MRALPSTSRTWWKSASAARWSRPRATSWRRRLNRYLSPACGERSSAERSEGGRVRGPSRGAENSETPHRLLQILVDLVEEAGGGEPLLIGADQQRQVFRHKARFHRIDADLLQGGGELRQRRIVVELGAVRETARPGKDRGDRIGRG